MDSIERIEASRQKLAEEMRTLVGDAEDVLKAAAKQGGEYLGAARERLERSVSVAKAELADAEQALVARARRHARETDEYVHDHPWSAIGIAAGAGLLIGLLIGRR